jgi:hypothetical protein
MAGHRRAMLYALVMPTGPGGLITVSSSSLMFVCTWKANPVSVDVEKIALVSRANVITEVSVVPAPVGRAVLTTLQGISHAIDLGARVDFTGRDIGGRRLIIPNRLGTTTMLSNLLADGCKAAFTLYTLYFIEPLMTNTAPPSITACASGSRSVIQHWKFGNQNNLGWVAIVLTLGAGLFAIAVALRVKGKPRLVNLDPFSVEHSLRLAKQLFGAWSRWCG